MPAATPAQLKDSLVAAGQTDYVILTASGQVMEAGGTFLEQAKCEAALAVMQHTATILKSGEKLKRMSMAFEDCTYVATTANLGGKSYGVIVKQAGLAAMS